MLNRTNLKLYLRKLLLQRIQVSTTFILILE